MCVDLYIVGENLTANGLIWVPQTCLQQRNISTPEPLRVTFYNRTTSPYTISKDTQIAKASPINFMYTNLKIL